MMSLFKRSEMEFWCRKLWILQSWYNLLACHFFRYLFYSWVNILIVILSLHLQVGKVINLLFKSEALVWQIAVKLEWLAWSKWEENSFRVKIKIYWVLSFESCILTLCDVSRIFFHVLSRIQDRIEFMALQTQ